jgi:hypothetical protein
MAELSADGREAAMRLSVLLVLALAATPSIALAAVEPPTSPWSPGDIMRRIRSEDPRVRDAFAFGVARSASFRDLVRRVEARDVIVYIEMDQQLRGRLAGRMRWVISTKAARYVRVSINPELTGFHFVATLAHELQHVVEVGDAPTVIDEPSLSAFYRHVGSERRARSEAWDTDAAKLAGEVVRKELIGSNGDASRATPSERLISRSSAGQR